MDNTQTPKDQYAVRLSNFEGPLDLLLHLISQAKIEPKDIFVSEITEQYLAYIDAHTLEMEAASEFIQMAATLIYIKSRSLLPKKRRQEDLDEDGLTPEQRLIARLTEYKRYKEVSETLRDLEASSRQIYKLPEEVLDTHMGEPVFSNADVNALATAFLRLIKKAGREKPQRRDVVIHRAEYNVREQSRVILARLVIKRELTFEELLSKSPQREEIAATFLALLELLHEGEIAVAQNDVYGQIYVRRREERSRHDGR